MISSLSLVVRNDIVPQGTLQPITDVAAYLVTRKAAMYWEEEEALFVTLPGVLRVEVKALQGACELVWRLVKAGGRVQPSCKAVLHSFTRWHWHSVTFRGDYDLWIKERDWTVFVNCARAGAAWQEGKKGLPVAFLKYCAARIGQYKRDDARKEAIRSIIDRQWQTGRTFAGEREAIPGYGFREDWIKTHGTDRPRGWSYSNILRQIKAQNILPRATAAMLLQGTAAAKDFVPHVHGTREGLRFLEEVQFDDVKTDWRIFDPQTKQACDLWLLIARDRATSMLLGFGMRPARTREDGTQEHLKLQDMKQLCGFMLERYGLPPYPMVWKIERGTATLSEGAKNALQEMLGDRVKISYSSMIGGTSPAGYFERRIGNSKGKASLESHNRGMHLIGASIPGQVGPHYGARPSDIAARDKECREIAELSSFLPDHLRGELGYSLLTLDQARRELVKIFDFQNRRDDHQLEGFETVLEWFCPNTSRWQPQTSAPEGVELKKRMEMPIERAARLMNEVKGWTRVSPEIITAFYEHLERPVIVQDNGEIEFLFEGKKLYFSAPNDAAKIPAGTKLLAYCHTDDPTFLYLTNGKGAIVGTWLQRARVKDKAAVAQAIAHQGHALKQARDFANELNAPERAQLDAMRERNAQLHRDHGFVEVTAAQVPTETISSPIAAALAATTATTKESLRADKKREREEERMIAEFGDEAAAAILKPTPKP